MDKQVGIRNYERRRRDIVEMNLTSDLLSSVTFEDLLAAQDVLRIMTGMDELIVLRVEPQRSFRNMYGHSSISDVWAEDAAYNQYNLEIQIAENEDHLRRSRFIQSRIDSRCLSTGMEYGELPELYLIFITEKDFLGTNEGSFEIVHRIEGLGCQVDDGVHEIYANLEKPVDDDTKQRLLKYIKDTNNLEISTEGFENLAKRVNDLKSEEGGLRYMCSVMEREWAEGRAEGREEGREEGNLLHLIRQTIKKCEKGMAVGEIAEALEEEVETIERIVMAIVITDSQDAEEVYKEMKEIGV